MRRFPLALVLAVSAPFSVGGCDMLGIESAEKIAASREADGKAIGSACRHAGRAIEDCFAIYKKADRAAVFAGWRDMNDYMRENKIEPVAPQLAAQAEGRRRRAALTPALRPADAHGVVIASAIDALAHILPVAFTSNSPTTTRSPRSLLTRTVVRRSCCAGVAEAARQPQHQAGAGRQHLLAVAEEVRLDAVLARLGDA